MKLLVLAQVPPPHHGQSAMVELLLRELPKAAPNIEIHHVNLSLSRSTSDIGSWRWGKFFALFKMIGQVWALNARHERMSLYYVPAPGKRSALYRDLILMLGCRLVSSRLILHWHATGLGEWIISEGHRWERFLAKRALGGADVSIVLGQALKRDAAEFTPKKLIVVRNGIDDPCEQSRINLGTPKNPLHAIFVGLCSVEKGALAAAEGVREANRRNPGSFTLTLAGEFDSSDTAQAFAQIQTDYSDVINHIGFASGMAKQKLFEDADVLIFPTQYPHEAHPLVLVEALAYDLPIIVNKWRAVAEGLPKKSEHIRIIEGRGKNELADALEAIKSAPPRNGQLRQYFLQNYLAVKFAHNIAKAIL